MSVTAFKQVSDNALSTTSTVLTATGVTSITLASGTGALFPSPGNGFYVTLWTGTDPTLDANEEKLLCTARSGDTLTIAATTKTHSGTVNVALLDLIQNTIDLQTAVNNIESGTNPVPGTGGSGGSSFSTPLVVTNATSTAATIGPNGATNPVLTVDGSTTSGVSGLSISGSAAAGLGAIIRTTGTDTNVSMTFRPKGSGSFQVYPNGDAANIFSILNSTNTKVYWTVDTAANIVQNRSGGTFGMALATGANAFVVSSNTNIITSPGFNVDMSSTSPVAGWNVKVGTAGTQAALSVISTATNENGTINSKGTGNLILNNTATGQIQLGTGLILSNTTVTATGTLTTAYSVVRVNSGSATTQTLPTSPATGTEILIKNVGAGVVTVAGTIDGATNYSLSAQYKLVRVMYNGTSWDITGNN